jgi:hypothetical protein
MICPTDSRCCEVGGPEGQGRREIAAPGWSPLARVTVTAQLTGSPWSTYRWLDGHDGDEVGEVVDVGWFWVYRGRPCACAVAAMSRSIVRRRGWGPTSTVTFTTERYAGTHSESKGSGSGKARRESRTILLQARRSVSLRAKSGPRTISAMVSAETKASSGSCSSLPTYRLEIDDYRRVEQAAAHGRCARENMGSSNPSSSPLGP